MCKIRLLSILLFLACNFSAKAQNALLDTARNYTSAAKSYKSQQQISQALKMYLQAIPIFEKLKQNEELQNAYTETGYLYRDWGLYDKSLLYFQKAYRYAEQKGNDKEKIVLLQGIGYSYQQSDEPDSAIRYYQKEYELYKQQQDKRGMITTLFSLSNVYKSQNKYEQALATNEEILELQRGLKDSVGTAIALNNLGFICKYLKKYDIAIQYFTEAIEINKRLKRSNDNITPLINVGILYQNKKKLKEAMAAFMEAKNIIESSKGNEILDPKNPKKTTKPNEELANIYNLISRVYYFQQEYEPAKEYANKAVAYGKQLKNQEILIDGYNNLSDIYQKQSNYSKALEYYQKHIAARDTLMMQEKAKEKALQQRKNLSDRTENELKLLQIEKEIRELELRKAQLENEKKEQAYEILLKNNELKEIEQRKKQLEQEKAYQLLIVEKQRADAEKQRIETERKQQEIELLQKNNEVQNLALKQKDLEQEDNRKKLELLKKEKDLNDQKLREERNRRLFFIGLAVLFALIIVLVLISYFNNRKNAKKLYQQKLEIEDKNEELTAQKEQVEKANTALVEQKQKLQSANVTLLEQKAEIELKNIELEEQKAKIEAVNQELSAQKEEIERKNKTLEYQQLEIQQKNQELLQRQEELETTLENLRQTQDQLVQSEKMAALGQLIAGIAHEVNTPLGAIKASVNNISASLKESLEQLPKLREILTADQLVMFFEMVRNSGNSDHTITSKEERKIKREMVGFLEDNGFNDADSLADSLVDMGIHDATQYLPLLKSENIGFIMQLAYNIAMQQKNAKNALVAVEKASKVVFALKKFARYDHSGEMTKADIADNVETVITLYHNQIKQGVEVVRNYQPTPQILCYPDELNQVWTNIIHNALHAMTNKGTLTIDVFTKDGFVHVHITDTGHGIPPEIQDKIFNAFFTTKKAGEGSGLGLDIVRRIIDKHNGKISFESVPGKTTFMVALPVKE